MNIHLIHAITAFAIMLVGWSALTYFVVRQAHGPRERRFTIRASIICFPGIVAVGAIENFVTKGYLPGFGAIMFFVFLFLRRKQLDIRREEDADA